MTTAETTESRMAAFADRIEALERENKILREENALLKKWRFGRSTERLEPGQLQFFETGDFPEVSPQTDTEDKPARKTKKPFKGHGRAAFPEHLKREVIRHELCEDDRKCPTCCAVMEEMGQDVSERGRLIPAKITVDRHIRMKYGCPHGHGVITAPIPDGVIDGGKYDASVYAGIVTAKYNDHLPLNRLEGIYKRYGIQIPKQTMWDMLVRVDELIAQPVLKQMRLELLEEHVLHADETSVALRIEGQKGSKKGWVWGWRNEPDGERPSKLLIEFHQGRGKNVPTKFLGDWSEVLIADGYPSYDAVCKENGITRAGCFAHTRRYFREALETGSTEATPLLRMINRLFALERAVRGRAKRRKFECKDLLQLRGDVRKRSSSKQMKRLLKAASELELKRTTLPKSKLGKAVSYLLNQQKPLSVFISDPRVPIHNNDEERDLRHVVVGRNNWMVFASQRGGEVACRLYSLVLSCRQNDVNPEAYVADVLMKVATTPATEIATLTPWAWGARQSEL